MGWYGYNTAGVIESLNKINMNHFRRSSKAQKERYEIGIQSEPNFLGEEGSSPAPPECYIPSKSVTLSSATPAIRSENVGRLVQGLDTAEI